MTAHKIGLSMSSQLSPLIASLRASRLTVGLVGCKSRRAVEVVDALASLPLATVEIFGLSGVPRRDLPASLHIATDAADDSEAAHAAVGAWQAGAVDIVLKLDVSTKVLMQAVLDSRAGGWFTHVALILDEGRGSRFLLADSGLNRQPAASDIVRIVERVAIVARALGTAQPRIALLSYREDADPLFPLFGEVLAKHVDDLSDLPVTLVGPTSFDVAVAETAAAAKGLAGGGVCDGIVSPDIIAANALYKAHMLRPDCVVAGIVVDEFGHALAVPSRAASLDARLASVALAATVSNWGEQPGQLASPKPSVRPW
jgi:phosphotransacetylase